ncbi:MAG: VOC family protein [Candidatus Levyibacteriota bacterium]
MIQSIGVHIKVKDFQKSVKFYEALGFKKVFEYGPDKTIKEKYNGVTYEHNNCKLELADGHIAVKERTFQETIESSKISLMINVDSIKKIIDNCQKANIPLAVYPRHYYWGTLEVVIKNPDGVVLVFICPYSKAEEKRVHANEILPAIQA